MAGKNKKTGIYGIRNLNNRTLCTCVGEHPVLACTCLSVGLLGLIVPLESEPCSDERIDEVCGLLSQLIEDGYKFVPPGVMSLIRNSVSEAALLASDNPTMDKFDVAIPLRKAEEGRNFLQWDHVEHDWKLVNISHINGFVNVSGQNIMLIVGTKEAA